MRSVRSFASFSKTERFGVVALAILLAILLAVKLSMKHLSKPHFDTGQELAYRDAYEHFEQALEIENEAAMHKADSAAIADTSHLYLDDGIGHKDFPDTLDINTATEKQFKMLKGVGTITARKIVAKRAEQGGFNNIEEFRKTCNLSDKVFQQLQIHLKVSKIKPSK